MRLRIEHVTRYSYDRAVRFGRHRLVLRPRESHDLHIEEMRLRLEPSHQLVWLRDIFGNSIALVDWLEPANVLTIVNEVTVERFAPFPGRALHQPLRVPFPASYDPLEAPVVASYQTCSFPEDAAAVRAWLESGPTPDPMDAEGTVLALCDLVHRTVVYQRRAERGVQSPARTLECRTGSCRDMATLMMEAARVMGVAARFASGYLHCAASRAGAASTHAWTEVYLPTLGWRGFDPTTGSPISLGHIPTGVSSHPRGVMPVSGAYIGTRAEYKALDVTVKTEDLTESAGATTTT